VVNNGTKEFMEKGKISCPNNAARRTGSGKRLTNVQRKGDPTFQH
jgi:hypothetical protein